MPNKGRGEIEIKVGGQSYVLRPSFGTMAEIEDATDKSAAELLLRGRNDASKLKAKEVVTVLWVAATRSKNRNVPSIEEFGEKIRREMGIVSATVTMLHFLGNSICSDEQREQAEAESQDEADPSEPSEEDKSSD